MIRLPYGVSNFADLITQNYYYIDKTKYIEVIENLVEKYILFIRPRKFGKSLFVSILDYYYNIKHKDKFKKLFGPYYIGKHPTPLHNQYLILRFQFAGINTKTEESTYTGFKTNVITGLKTFRTETGWTEVSDIINKDNTPEGYLSDIIELVRFKGDKKLYVLIDEYDHFANELVSFQTELFKNIVSKNGFVRQFYEILKDGTNTIIDRLFITGVTPLTLDSLTSGFNIKSNLTTSQEAHEMMGFTEDETRYLVAETLKDCGQEEKIDEVYNFMKQYYNGYKFNDDADKRLFNSDMVLYYLKEYGKICNHPKKILDTNVVSDYSKMKNLFLLSQNYRQELITTLLEEKEVMAQLTEEFSLEKKFDDNDLISLLFYMGLLTIKDSDAGILNFVIPNYVISTLYFSYFREALEEQTNYEPNNRELMFAVRDMAKFGKIDTFIT